MTIRSLPWVVTSGSETPVAFTRFSMIWRIDLEVLGSRDLVADLLRLVLDAETALQVEPELRLDRAAARVAGIGRVRPGTKSMMRARTPMMTIRIGPALRISGG